jgi:hypothetical protein
MRLSQTKMSVAMIAKNSGSTGSNSRRVLLLKEESSPFGFPQRAHSLRQPGKGGQGQKVPAHGPCFNSTITNGNGRWHSHQALSRQAPRRAVAGKSHS